METAATDLGLQFTGTFLHDTGSYVVHKQEAQPFLNRTVNDKDNDNDNHKVIKQSFYEKYRLDILKFRTPFIIICYHYIGYLYNVPYLPIKEFYKILFYIPTTIILFMTYLTYFVSSYSHPGQVPNEYLSWNGSIDNKPMIPLYSQVLQSKIIESGYSININDEKKLFCSKCKKYRPLRAHHCSTCNHCICRMDHHCWFLQNCVGINNHRYFFQFLVYLFLILFDYEITYYISKGYIFENESYLIYSAATFLFYMGILFELFVIGLFFTNMRCVLNNQTYLEQKFDFDQMIKYGFVAHYKMYDKGSRFENFKDVFGESKLRWFLPLKFNNNELDKRLMRNSSKQFDLLPCYRE